MYVQCGFRLGGEGNALHPVLIASSDYCIFYDLLNFSSGFQKVMCIWVPRVVNQVRVTH